MSSEIGQRFFSAISLAPEILLREFEDRESERRRLRPIFAVLVIAALALALAGCTPMFFRRDARCHGVTAEDPLVEIRSAVLSEPLRYGVVTPRPTESLYLMVQHDGEAAMVHEPQSRALLRSRCRRLEADDLAEVIRAVERLDNSTVAERRVERPGCLDITSIVLRGNRLAASFNYCGVTPPAAVVRFVEEISGPLRRRFGEELSEGLAATVPWASPVPLGPVRD